VKPPTAEPVQTMRQCERPQQRRRLPRHLHPGRRGRLGSTGLGPADRGRSFRRRRGTAGSCRVVRVLAGGPSRRKI
jgi:hypothetical protein